MPDNSSKATAVPSKVSRACEYCRTLKVRCEAGSGDINKACTRCTKDKRACVFPVVTRTRRRKRADARVTELEKEVRALASMLQVSGPAADIHPSLSKSDFPGDLPIKPPEGDVLDDYILRNSAEQTNQWPTPLAPAPKSLLPDVIERQILTWDLAAQLLSRYQRRMTPLYPIVVLPEAFDALRFRYEKPVLFLAIISASAANYSEALRDVLHNEVLRTYADRVMVRGEKSLELVQALLVTVAWYHPCDTYDDTKYLQFTQTACTMIHELQFDEVEINLSTLSMQAHPASQLRIQHRLEENIDFHRALVACYLGSSNIDLVKHCPTMMPIAAQINKSLKVLETSVTPNEEMDNSLAAWARLQRLTQEARTALGTDYVEVKVRITDAHVPLTLETFRRQFFEVKRLVIANSMSACLAVTFHAGMLHMHEIALHDDHHPGDFHPPYNLKTDFTKTPLEMKLTHINSVMICVSSSHELLDVFLAIDLPTICVVPSMILVKMTYAAVVLFKVFLSVTTACHPLQKVLDWKQLRLSEYLDRLFGCLSQLIWTPASGAGSKFVNIIERLQFAYNTRLAMLENAEMFTRDHVAIVDGRSLASNFRADGGDIDQGQLHGQDSSHLLDHLAKEDTSIPAVNDVVWQSFLESLPSLGIEQAQLVSLNSEEAWLPSAALIDE